jgi:hypothetical protein
MSLEGQKKALEGLFTRLNESSKIQLALKMAKISVPIWEAYKKRNTLLLFKSEVYNQPDVDMALLRETLAAIETDELADLRQSFNQFRQPIVMLQEGEWELSISIKNAFYSVYNLAKAVLSAENKAQRSSCVRQSVMQSFDAINKSFLLSMDEWKDFLEDYRLAAEESGL